jgi:hypothetical protein
VQPVPDIEVVAADARKHLPEWARCDRPLYINNDPVQTALFLCAVRQDPLDLIELNAIWDFNRTTEGIVEDWRDMAPDDPNRAGRRAEWIKRRAEGRARVKWWHEQVAAIDAEQARAGIAELEATFDRLSDRVIDFETAIHDTAAHDAIGIAVKLRLALRLRGDTEANLDCPSQISLSALRDAKRLAGGSA